MYTDVCMFVYTYTYALTRMKVSSYICMCRYTCVLGRACVCILCHLRIAFLGRDIP